MMLQHMVIFNEKCTYQKVMFDLNIYLANDVKLYIYKPFIPMFPP